MKYINQLEHRDIPYRTNVKNDAVSEEKKQRNIALSGCGICCSCMMIELLTDKTLELEECVKISEECVANHSLGTDMTVLGPVLAEKFNLNYSDTNDLDTAINNLKSGGQVIARVRVPDGKAIGLFTKGEHYILLVSTDGKDFCILDPSYKTDKFDIPERKGLVDTSTAPYLYCDVNTVDSEGVVSLPKYYLFSRKRG